MTLTFLFLILMFSLMREFKDKFPKTVQNKKANIRGQIFLKSGGMMRSDNNTQRVRFVFGLRRVLTKPWFINNIKYTQDWPKGQSNKSFTSSGVIGSHGEARSMMLQNLAEPADCPRSTVLSSSSVLQR